VQTIIAAPLKIKKAVGNIKGLAAKGGTLLQSFKKLLKEIPHISVKDKLSKLSGELKGKFLEAFSAVKPQRLLWRFIDKSRTKSNFMDYEIPRQNWFKYQLLNHNLIFNAPKK